LLHNNQIDTNYKIWQGGLREGSILGENGLPDIEMEQFDKLGFEVIPVPFADVSAFGGACTLQQPMLTGKVIVRITFRSKPKAFRN
jgi:hypothetical protein